jgi:acyl dehydratase
MAQCCRPKLCPNLLKPRHQRGDTPPTNDKNQLSTENLYRSNAFLLFHLLVCCQGVINQRRIDRSPVSRSYKLDLLDLETRECMIFSKEKSKQRKAQNLVAPHCKRNFNTFRNTIMNSRVFLQRIPTARLCNRSLVLSVGSVLQMERVFTSSDIQAFSVVSQDKNPLHFNSETATNSQFESPVVHGMLVASMFSALVGNSIPGSIYLSQNLKWVHPVYAGDNIIAKVEVLKLRKMHQSMIASMKTTCVNQDKVLVLEGQAMCQFPSVE